jgi:phage terminase small subunit
MPSLQNAKHELFAQELAKGKTADEAYQLAGYKENRHNASRLKANEFILARIAELQQRGADLTGVTIEGQTARLARIADKAEALGEAAGLAVAARAHMDIAKLNGLVVDRSESTVVRRDITDQPLSEDAWAAEHVTAH